MTASGLVTFAKGLLKFLEERSIIGYKLIFRSKLTQNVRCKENTRTQVSWCLVYFLWHLVGHCELQEAGPDGFLV